MAEVALHQEVAEGAVNAWEAGDGPWRWALGLGPGRLGKGVVWGGHGVGKMYDVSMESWWFSLSSVRFFTVND